MFGTEWRSAAGGALDVLEPATGAKITRVGNATAADVLRAASEARAAQRGWAATPHAEHAAILRKAARVLEDNQEELIPWIAILRSKASMRETASARAPDWRCARYSVCNARREPTLRLQNRSR